MTATIRANDYANNREREKTVSKRLIVFATCKNEQVFAEHTQMQAHPYTRAVRACEQV